MLAAGGVLAKHLTKRMTVVKNIIKWVGRPEHYSQVLGWNWESRDVIRGDAPKIRKFQRLLLDSVELDFLDEFGNRTILLDFRKSVAELATYLQTGFTWNGLTSKTELAPKRSFYCSSGT